ncbi:MAG: DUF423 domain-containing protein [Gemmatimonadota bacterium]
MTDTARTFLVLGSALAALAVTLGAFGAHALKGRLSPEDLEIYRTAVLYHFLHALGLIATALAVQHLPEAAAARWAGWALLAGVVLFSGSLYLLVLTGARLLGAVTPLGGAAFIAGWVLLAAAALRS